MHSNNSVSLYLCKVLTIKLTKCLLLQSFVHHMLIVVVQFVDGPDRVSVRFSKRFTDVVLMVLCCRLYQQAQQVPELAGAAPARLSPPGLAVAAL